MEITATAAIAGRAEIDTSRPFQSVREAVEVFGSSRASSASSSKFTMMPPAASSSSPSQQPSALLCSLKKLELELAEARSELAELKQRQSQMEAAVSSVGVQLASGAFSGDGGLRKGKELAVVAVAGAQEEDGGESDGGGRVRSDLWDESRAEQWMASSLEYLPSLSEALAIKMVDDDVRKVKKKSSNKAKKKPQQQKKKQRKSAVSLVGGIFSKRYSR